MSTHTGYSDYSHSHGLLYRDWGSPRHICTGTGARPATSAPGLGLTLPHLHRDWGSPRHTCTGTGAHPATPAPGQRLAPQVWQNNTMDLIKLLRAVTAEQRQSDAVKHALQAQPRSTGMPCARARARVRACVRARARARVRACYVQIDHCPLGWLVRCGKR